VEQWAKTHGILDQDGDASPSSQSSSLMSVASSSGSEWAKSQSFRSFRSTTSSDIAVKDRLVRSTQEAQIRQFRDQMDAQHDEIKDQLKKLCTEQEKMLKDLIKFKGDPRHINDLDDAYWIRIRDMGKDLEQKYINRGIPAELARIMVNTFIDQVFFSIRKSKLEEKFCDAMKCCDQNIRDKEGRRKDKNRSKYDFGIYCGRLNSISDELVDAYIDCNAHWDGGEIQAKKEVAAWAHTKGHNKFQNHSYNNYDELVGKYEKAWETFSTSLDFSRSDEEHEQKKFDMILAARQLRLEFGEDDSSVLEWSDKKLS